MPNLKVIADYSLGNIREFDAAVRNSALANAAAIEQANTKVASSFGKISGPLTSSSGIGLFKTNVATTLDAVNKSFIQTGDVVRKTLTDYKYQIDQAGNVTIKPVFDTAYEGSFRKVVGDLDLYNAALKKTAVTEQQILAGRQQLQMQLGGIAQNVQGATVFKTQTEADLINLRTKGTQANLIQAAQLSLIGESDPAIITKRTAEITAATAKLEAAAVPLEARIVQLNADIKGFNLAATNAVSETAAREKALMAANPAYAQLTGAAGGYVPFQKIIVPPIQKDLATVLAQSKDLRTNLLSSGLGAGTQYGTQEFRAALAQQEAAVSSYTNNLRTNVRTVQGSFKDVSGLTHNFTVDLDQNGKVVGRWGGQLSSAGQFLNQTVRNLQKVIQWTIATSVVFGALAAVVTNLRSINDLNASLAHLSITAQTSAEDTQSLFKGIAQVAIATATPLTELVKAADDIALATRVAGQSMDEWKGKIISLTTAVGIFTNLTGKDTVEATDLLSAAFKQLQIAPDQLIGILSKVTATAGGQSTAIADIAQALGTVSEAAKAAGFSVDDIIGTVQTLAQVTNKTSADIATSMKNLFGSLSSVGSVKELAKFGIAVKDTEGNLKPFLDVYHEVADAIAKGIIPPGQVQDVYRALGGGPRRSPDVAAVLGALPLIDQAITKSANASNEALIANAKILDTNSAKIQQFQNAVDLVLFQRFGKVIQDATANITSFGTAVLGMFDKINPDILATIVQFTAIAVGARIIAGAVRLIAPAFGLTALTKGVSGLTAGLKAAAIEALVLQKYTSGINSATGKANFINPTTGNFTTQAYATALAGQNLTVSSGLAALLKGNIGKIGAIAGIAGLAGASLAGAKPLGIDQQGLGIALQTIGGIATFVPGLQAVGLATLGIGTALQFFSKGADVATKSQAELSSEIITSIQQLKDAQAQVQVYADQQKAAGLVLDTLRGKTKLTADEQTLLTTTTQNYVTATLALSDANKTVADSFQQLLDKLPGVKAAYQDLQDIAIANPNSPDILKLQADLNQKFLEAEGNIFTSPPAPLSTTYRPPVAGTGTIATLPGGQTVDIKDLISTLDIDTLKKLLLPSNITTATAPNLGRGIGPITYTTTQEQAQIPQNALVSGYLKEILTNLKGQIGTTITQKDFDILSAAAEKFSSSVSSFSEASIHFAALQGAIQSKVALGTLTVDQANNEYLRQKIGEQLSIAASQYTLPTEPHTARLNMNLLPETNQTIRSLASQELTGKPVSVSTLIQATTEMLKFKDASSAAGSQYTQLEKLGNNALNIAIYQYLQKDNLSTNDLADAAKRLGTAYLQAAEDAQALNDAIAAGTQAADQSFGQRMLQLQIAQNSGTYDKNAKGLADLRATAVAAHQANIDLTNSFSTLSDEALASFNDQLAKTIGLEGTYLTKADMDALQTDNAADTHANYVKQLEKESAQLIQNAVDAGVNAEGIKAIEKEVAILIGLINAIPSYHQVLIDVTTRLNNESGDTPQSLFDEKLARRLQNQQDAADAATKKQESITQQIIDEINKIFGTGNLRTPSAGGGGAANKPGLLDIPKEFIDQSTLDSIRKGVLTPEAKAAGFTSIQQLLAQATASARALQHAVPGADKENQKNIVELLSGTKILLQTRGVGEEYLRKALEELTTQIKKQNDILTKADTIRRIRVGAGDFAAFANVPLNSQSGVSVGSPQGPISINLDINGQLLTPAQFSSLANQIAAALKSALASGAG